MRILVSIGGPIQDYSRLSSMLPLYDYIIASDGAAMHLVNLNLKPNEIIGDFDSLKTIPPELKNAEITKLPEEKDHTDGELAIELAIKKGPNAIDFIGLTGGLIDHTLANIQLLRDIPANIKVTAYGDEEIIYRVTHQIVLKDVINQRFSILPLHGKPPVTTSGLKYALTEETLKSATHGISNVAVSNEVEVSIHEGSGMLLLIRHVSR